MKKIRIFDTTLRDGEQAPGFAMTKEEKLVFAKKLQELGVDVIEAGFPISSEEDFAAVASIAKECREPEVCAIARCNEKDIARAIEALEMAVQPRVHTFIATSDIHLKHKLKMTKDQVLKRAVMGVTQAKKFTSRVQFSPEDATRTDRNFLVKVLEAVIEAGADVVNITDTVGFFTPDEYGSLIAFLAKNVKGIENVTISAHCHNDLGLAVANSLSGVLNGASQVECTVNGIGERAGNAALEEVVMALKIKHSLYHAETSVHTQLISSTSQLLEEITGQRIPLNKAIVGKNAFAHGSGIHQHGILSAEQTYSIFDPKDIGYKSHEIALSKHSGKHGIKFRLKQLGIDLGDLFDEFYLAFIALAERKKILYDEDLLNLVDHVKRNH